MAAAVVRFWPRFTHAMAAVVAPIAITAAAAVMIYGTISQRVAFQTQLDALNSQVEELKSASAGMKAREEPAQGARHAAAGSARQADVTGALGKVDVDLQPQIVLEAIEIKNFNATESGALDAVLQFRNSGPGAAERVRVRKRIVLGTPRNFRTSDEAAELAIGPNEVQSISLRSAQASIEQKRRILAGESSINVFGELRIAKGQRTSECIRYRWTSSGAAAEPSDNVLRLHPAEAGNGPC